MDEQIEAESPGRLSGATKEEVGESGFAAWSDCKSLTPQPSIPVPCHLSASTESTVCRVSPDNESSQQFWGGVSAPDPGSGHSVKQ